MKALTGTDFKFEGQKSVYHGKVRDVYNINDDLMVMVATDRISAFDVGSESDCSQVPRCNDRHLPQLETGYSRPYGDCRTEVRGIPRRDDHPIYPNWFCMA